MRSTLVLRASHARQPMIKFLGKRTAPSAESIDHTPQPHPASPIQSLPDSFASYRSRVQQHGPIGHGVGNSNRNTRNSNSSSTASAAPSPPSSTPTSTMIESLSPYGPIGGKSGRSLGSVRPKEGEFFDRSELPSRFRRMAWTDAEMDAVTSGGASTTG